MASTIIDSRIFGDMFSDARMRDVWSDENRTAKYLDIERALAKVQGQLGIIPKDAADEIVRNCNLSQIDWVKLKAKTEQIGYPIIAVVNQINANCRDKLGEYCHWGATTQDITDTAAVLQMREGLALVEQDLDEIGDALAALAKKYRDTPVIGRSNLQQATPITFGYKMASILAGIDRHRERLQQLKPRVLMGEFGGASGTLSSLEKGAMETQAGLMKELGLAQPLISWHTVRDTIAEVGAFLGLVGGSLGKIAMDVKLMMQTEVAEVFEPFAPGRGSSSTMPQKRNPISCLYIHANISVARQHAAALMDAMVADVFTTRRSPGARNRGRSRKWPWTMLSVLREETSRRTWSRGTPRASGGSCASRRAGNATALMPPFPQGRGRDRARSGGRPRSAPEGRECSPQAEADPRCPHRETRPVASACACRRGRPRRRGGPDARRRVLT